MRSPAVAVAATVVSALGYAAVFPPPGASPLAFVALCPWLLAVAAGSARRGAGLGVLWGGVAGTALLGWFFPAMWRTYFGLAPSIGWLALATIGACWHGVPMAVLGAWTAWLVGRGCSGPLPIAAVFALGELARTRAGFGYSWALLGTGLVDWTRLVQTADVAGPYGVGAVAVLVNVAVAGWWNRALVGQRPVRATLLALSAVLLSVVYGAGRLAAPPTGRGVPIAVLAGDAGVTTADLAAATRAAALAPGTLVVWPEYAFPDYLQERSERSVEVTALAATNDVDLVLGGPAYARGADGPLYSNGAWVVRSGRVDGRYDKQHLVPFAEYRPLGSGSGPAYHAGTQATPLRTRHGFVGAFICVEAFFPDLVRQFTRQGAVLLANLSNDGWYAHPAAARHVLQMTRLRAIENRRWTVRAVQGGPAAVIDPQGAVTVAAPAGAPAVLRATVAPRTDRSFYVGWGDVWACVAGAIVVGVAGRAKRAQRA